MLGRRVLRWIAACLALGGLAYPPPASAGGDSCECAKPTPISDEHYVVRCQCGELTCITAHLNGDTDVSCVGGEETSQRLRRLATARPPQPKCEPPASTTRSKRAHTAARSASVPLGRRAAHGASPSPQSFAIPPSRREPRYPSSALRRGVEGWVHLALLIGPLGYVKGAQVIDASPRDTFERSALAAVRRWRYHPRIIDDRPVSQREEVVIHFRIEDGD